MFVVPALVWLLYIALEPHLRRVWPETMIGWSRLLAGSVRDPLVGRDVLVGVLIAIGDGLILALHTHAAALVGPAAAVSGWRLQQSVRRHGRLQRPAPRRALRALADHRLGDEHPRLGRDDADVLSLVRARCAPPAALARDGGDDPGIDGVLCRHPRRLAAGQRPGRSLRAVRPPTSRCSRRFRRRSCSWRSGSACSRCWSRRL